MDHVPSRALRKVRTFPAEHIAGLQRLAWDQATGANDWRGLLRPHRASGSALLTGMSAWTLPYAGRIYLIHRDPGTRHWCITLHETPDRREPVAWDDLVTIVHHDTRRSALDELVEELAGTLCDHGNIIGDGPCTGCQAVEDDYTTRY